MNIQKGAMLREGKAKILFETSEADCLIQYFKDDATAFNALKRSSIEGKGVVNNTVSSWIFEYLEKQKIPTHYLKKLSDREMLVKRVQILPVETVVRNRAAGSILKRLGLEKGVPLSPALIEYFYKSDALGDPLIGESHILHFGWATAAQLARIQTLALKVNETLSDLFQKAALELIDFKLEFGTDTSGNVLLADEFSPDGCRLWDKATGESKDKDRFRQDLGGVQQAYLEVQNRLAKVLEVA